MKKFIPMLLIAMFLGLVSAKSISIDTFKPRANAYLNPHEIYYILFTDGCFHLGYEELIGNQLYWIPFEHGEYLGGSLTICIYSREMEDWC
jgi:hypothetical protein